MTSGKFKQTILMAEKRYPGLIGEPIYNVLLYWQIMQGISCLASNAPVNGMPQYPPPAPSRGIVGDLTFVISIAPGLEQYLKSNPLFST